MGREGAARLANDQRGPGFPTLALLVPLCGNSMSCSSPKIGGGCTGRTGRPGIGPKYCLKGRGSISGMGPKTCLRGSNGITSGKDHGRDSFFFFAGGWETWLEVELEADNEDDPKFDNEEGPVDPGDVDITDSASGKRLTLTSEAVGEATGADKAAVTGRAIF